MSLPNVPNVHPSMYLGRDEDAQAAAVGVALYGYGETVASSFILKHGTWGKGGFRLAEAVFQKPRPAPAPLGALLTLLTHTHTHTHNF